MSTAMSLRLPDAASRIVAELLNVRVQSSEVLHLGMMTFKCRVLTEQRDDVIVRFYPAGRASVVNQEPDLLARCLRAGITVPAPIGDSRSGPPAPLEYVAYRRIAGSTLREALIKCGREQLHHLAQDLGRHLFAMRNLVFEGAGELTSSRTAQVAADDGWATFVEHSLSIGLNAVRQHRLLAEPLANDLSRVIQRGLLLNGRESRRLVWGDFNFGNILVGPDMRVAGLIDFEGCLSGDPLATLGYGYAMHGTDPFFDLLLGAWRPALSDEDRDLLALYAILRAMRLARYAHLPLPTGRPRDALIDIVPGLVPAVLRLAEPR